MEIETSTSIVDEKRKRGRPQKYFTDEERRQANLRNVIKYNQTHGIQSTMDYYKANREKILAQRKTYYQNNKDKFKRKKEPAVEVA